MTAGTCSLAANYSLTPHCLNYAECREKVEEQLKTDITYFATTTDLWSSRMSEPFYTDKEWNLINKCLQTSYIPDDHMGEAISRGAH